MERLRELIVTIEIDTNKQSIKETFSLMEDETIDEFNERVANKIQQAKQI